MKIDILQGNSLDVLRTLPDESVHCCVTSPPYWGLRDYGTARWEGGSLECGHEGSKRYYTEQSAASTGGAEAFSKAGPDNAARLKKARWREGGECVKCGALHTDSQLGLEKTYQEHVSVMADLFEEVRRVLRKDGTLWLNYGDTYASSVNGRSAADVKTLGVDDRTFRDKPMSTVQGVLKPKDLCGMPWRVAFALQERGWYLRQDIIWHKPNPMPESTTDRCTKAHEYIFLFAKQPKYYFDNEAIKEPVVKGFAGLEFHTGKTGVHQLGRASNKPRATGNKTHKFGTEYEASESEEHRTKAGLLKSATTTYETRNKRSVWTVAPKPFREAHFATFPPDLIRPCILAGCPFGGTVLDPFFGAGTTALVARETGRNTIGIELNPEYISIAQRRLGLTIALPWENEPIDFPWK